MAPVPLGFSPSRTADPRTLKVVYLEPFFVRDEGNTNAFLEHLVEAYGKWPKHMITDGGWLWAPLPWGQRPASRAVVLPDREAFPQDGNRLGYRAIPEAELKPRSSEELRKGP